MSWLRLPGNFGRSERGAVTIEFVCTMPLFLVALAFAFEFGQFFVAHQSTVNNVRAASRYLSRVDLSDSDARRDARRDAARIIRTGQRSASAPTPAYLEGICATPTDCITIWTDEDLARVRVAVTYRPSLLPFSLPFVVREEFRIKGF